MATKKKNNKVRVTMTIDPQVLAKAKRRSKQTGIAISTATERFLLKWADDGDLPKLPVLDGSD